MADPLKPSLTLLVKIASAVVHVDEMLSPLGHGYDRIALQSLLDDAEIRAWIEEMGKQGFVPVKRGKRGDHNG